MAKTPNLKRRSRHGVVTWCDQELLSRGVLVAFSERKGGVSRPPFATLNLGSHVGDDPAAVDENRSRLLASLGIGDLRESLTMGEQVHGTTLATVTGTEAGSGACANSGRPPIAGTDALLTSEAGIPLMLCFADCVPVVLVAPGPAVAVVHAGWRGALGKLPSKAVAGLAERTGCDPSDVAAYIGPHIAACHYEVDVTILSQFVNTFGKVARALDGGLDLDAVVRRDLTDAGVPQWQITSLGACTAEETDRFFSYRAEQGQTGRHAALCCIAPPSSPRS